MLDDIDREAMREGFAISKSHGYRTVRPNRPQGVAKADVVHQSKKDAPMVALLEGDRTILTPSEITRKIANAMVV